MKLRIKDDTLRLRLTQSEVARLSEGEGVHSHTRFPDDFMLGYAVEPGSGKEITATLIDSAITVRVPAATARDWALSDQVSLTAEQPVGGGVLDVLIEKDFECLDPRPGESDSDAYPNPKARD
jgi:hypothetical protein